MAEAPGAEMKTYIIRFETNLNESMCTKIRARSEREAIKKIKDEYPTAFNIEVG